MDVVVVNVCLPDITGDWGYAVYQDFVLPSEGGAISMSSKTGSRMGPRIRTTTPPLVRPPERL